MLPHSNTPQIFLVYILIFFIAIVVRYFVAAGIFYGYYYMWRGEKFRDKRLSKRGWRKGQIRKEIFWSIKSSAIFAAVGAVTYFLWHNGLTAVYLDPAEYGYWYLPVSLIIVLFIHETYYYWVHRWMHKPKVFRKVHKIHHDSLAPTPWTAFAFHHWESIIEALILPVILVLIPVNAFLLGFYLLLMTVSSVINHLDIEIYPEAFLHSKIGKLFIGATHHHYHHEEYMTNFGLYFTFWDKWMGTESSKMEQRKKIRR